MEFLGIALPEWYILVMAAFAVLAGAIVQGATGVGLGMVSAPLLVLIDPIFLPAPLLLVILCVTSLSALRESGHIDWKGLKMAVVGRVPGTLVAGLTVALLPLSSFSMVFGIIILLAVAISVSGYRFQTNGRNLFLAGFASGYMGTITTVGSPAMALVYQNASIAIVRSTLSVYFAFGSSLSLIVLAALGECGLKQLVLFFTLIPSVFIGFWLSGFAMKKLNRSLIRKGVLVLCTFSGLLLIAKALY